MDKEVTGSREFLEEILLNAREEAKDIISGAEAKAESRKKAAAKQEEALLKEAESQLDREKAHREKLADQKISSEIRRRKLQLRDRFMTDALAEAKTKLTAMTETDEYESLLADWVLEAVMGLAVDRVELNGRMRERNIMTSDWLKAQEQRVKESYGRTVGLSLSEEAPLLGAGVVAKEKGGRLVYNNQIETRLLRNQSDLRKVIYEELFEE